jgi:O-antigen/teichoic acid export membrane protein
MAAEAAPVLPLLALAYAVAGMNAVPAATVDASNRPGVNSAYATLSGAVLLVTIFFATGAFGAVGAAASWLVVTSVATAAYVLVVAPRVTGARASLRGLLGIALLAAAAFGGARLLTNLLGWGPLLSLAGLAAAGLAVGGVALGTGIVDLREVRSLGVRPAGKGDRA